MFVYYNSETREITSISASQNSEGPFVEKEKQEVQPFIDGEKNFIDYIIDEQRNIVNKHETVIPFDINQKIHKLEERPNADFTVVHTKDGWQFKKTSSVNDNLYFIITEKNNPNILYRTMYFYASQIENKFLVPFENNKEKNLDCSIWILNKSFPICSLEIR